MLWGGRKRKASGKTHIVDVAKEKYARRFKKTNRKYSREAKRAVMERELIEETDSKQKIPHFHHSHLEAKGNRWYNLKDCMKKNRDN